jgi:hypothetical protein
MCATKLYVCLQNVFLCTHVRTMITNEHEYMYHKIEQLQCKLFQVLYLWRVILCNVLLGSTRAVFVGPNASLFSLQEHRSFIMCFIRCCLQVNCCVSTWFHLICVHVYAYIMLCSTIKFFVYGSSDLEVRACLHMHHAFVDDMVSNTNVQHKHIILLRALRGTAFHWSCTR